MRKVIKAKWVVKIPVESKVLVKKGQELAEGETLIKSSLGHILSVDLDKIFKDKDREERKEIVEKLKDRIWEKGEVMFFLGSFLKKKKLIAPEKGRVLGLDEFGDMRFGVFGEERKIMSPVKATCLGEKEGKLELEFKAREYKGEAIVMGKTWGRMLPRVIRRLVDLDNNCEGSIIMVEKVDEYFWKKAEAIGVEGVVVKKEEELVFETSLPVMSLSDFEWLALEGELENKDEMRALLNSKAGRLLLVLE